MNMKENNSNPGSKVVVHEMGAVDWRAHGEPMIGWKQIIKKKNQHTGSTNSPAARCSMCGFVFVRWAAQATQATACDAKRLKKISAGSQRPTTRSAYVPLSEHQAPTHPKELEKDPLWRIFKIHPANLEVSVFTYPNCGYSPHARPNDMILVVDGTFTTGLATTKIMSFGRLAVLTITGTQ